MPSLKSGGTLDASDRLAIKLTFEAGEEDKERTLAGQEGPDRVSIYAEAFPAILAAP